VLPWALNDELIERKNILLFRSEPTAEILSFK